MPKLQAALDSNDMDTVRALLADRFFSQKLNADHMQLYFDALAAAAAEGPLTRERVVAAIDCKCFGKIGFRNCQRTSQAPLE